MIKITNIYNDILEISDISFQKRAWLDKNESDCSSYVEVMCRLFDDNNFDSFVEQDAKKYGLDPKLISELKTLQEMLNNYEEKLTDSEIIQDPNWMIIVNQAKKVINFWNNLGSLGM